MVSNIRRDTPFFQQFAQEVEKLGGMYNAHLHLDRASILDDRYFAGDGLQVLNSSHISLKKKHHLINSLHQGPAYETEDLRQRVNQCLDVMVDCNTRIADSLVDVTADRVGLSALQTLTKIKQERAHEIELRLGAYSPLGFCDAEPERWEIFEEGARQADFIASLPEADELSDYPANIGFEEHCRRCLEIACETGKMLHVHTDQRNEPGETGTERLIEVIRQHGGPELVSGEAAVWAVHMISPSTYDDARFYRLVDDMLTYNIGIICCPSAALGMRQLRPLMTPTYNSIPRILELAAAGVHVRLASDNIADMASPTTTADLTDEVLVLSAAIRFYHVGILAKFAAGTKLDAGDIDEINSHLASNDEEVARVLGSSG
jgi:cytosine deaminase